MSDSINVRATLVATNEMSPAIRRVIADIEKLKAAAQSFSASFSTAGRAGMASMDGFDRTIKAAAAQMRGLSNVSKSSARSYADDWGRATSKRLSDARRMYQSLEKMEAGYQRQLERRMAAERRASIASASARGAGRLPAPSIRSMAIGAGIAGAGVGSALKKRMEVQASEVRAQMFGDLTAADVASLRKGFADKAGIKFGVGTTKVIDVAVEGLKAGIAKDVAGEFADLALKAQAGLDVDTQGVGKLLGRLATQMPWSKDRFSKILNAVAVSNNATAADGDEIIEAMRRSLSALTTTRMSPEQLAAIDATAISLGVQPHKAGTFVSFLTSQIAGAGSARGQQANDFSSAANALGFGGRRAMAEAMRDRPMEAISKILDNLARMPEALRTKVAKQIGGREWMDELLTLVLGRDKLKDVLKDIEGKPGFLDKTALQKIRSMQGKWASIAAAFGLVWEKVGAGFEKWFDQISDAFIGLADSFNFDSIKQHVDALVDGLREGFGLKEWGEAITSLARNFSASTIAKWREFGKGFAEGIREFASGLKTAFSALGFLAGKNPADAKEMGNLVAKLTGLTVALAVLSPLLSVLSAITLGLTGLGAALGLIGGSAVAMRVLAFLARFTNPAVAAAAMGDGRPDYHVEDLKGLQDAYREEREKNKALGLDRETRQKLRRLQNYQPSGDPMFQPTGYTTGQDLADNLKKFTGKVERAAFINGGNVTRAIYTGGRFDLMTAGGGGGGARSFMGGVPGPLTNKPGTALPGSILGSGGIIKRSSIPNFSGTGGSMADGLSRSAFERKFAGTPLSGKYDQIIAAAKANNIPPSLLAGVIAHETGNGAVLSGNNPGGIMDPATGFARKMKFAGLDDGINKTAQTVAKNYRRAGGDLDKMSGFYAPRGAANDPNGLNGGWPAGVRKNMIQLSDSSTGSAGSGDAVGWAQKFRGMNEYSDYRILASTLGGDVRGKSNAWCARFVNKALAEAGGKGTGSAVANSFQRYGSAVRPSDVIRNDVLLQTNGRGYNQPGGHVGMATGETRMMNGRRQIKMISGNDSDSVRERWIDADDPNLMVRRGNPLTGNVPVGLTSQVPPSSMIQNVPNVPPPSPGVGGGMMRGGFGPAQININGSSHDPEALATLVQRRIDESMQWRTHDGESEYT
ncbi:phage tail tape measure protein [Bradyrhizobium ottawaense]|uniref:phage tail tape measure protein n=1 Tax=Bradyrhizobium ottawaense TaxID=931866 RepID=UPI001BA8658B|nr:phage tail tape measure protein [Bradyrhizobium ottawaense]MBR1366350.1 phage tail tape measure protein [Bradyrhizobium ottawaense]